MELLIRTNDQLSCIGISICIILEDIVAIVIFVIFNLYHDPIGKLFTLILVGSRSGLLYGDRLLNLAIVKVHHFEILEDQLSLSHRVGDIGMLVNFEPGIELFEVYSLEITPAKFHCRFQNSEVVNGNRLSIAHTRSLNFDIWLSPLVFHKVLLLASIVSTVFLKETIGIKYLIVLVKIGIRAKRKTRAFEQESHWRAHRTMIGAILCTA